MRKILLALLSFSSLSALAIDDRSMPSLKDVVSTRDIKLLNAIEDRLKSRFQLYEIQVYVRDGVVYLTGTVTTTDEKRAIEEEVKGIGGVTNIRNRIQVRR